MFLFTLLSLYAEPLYIHISGLEEQPSVDVRHQNQKESIIMLPNGSRSWVGVAELEPYHFWNVHIATQDQDLYHNIIRKTSSHLYFGYDPQRKTIQEYHDKGTKQEHVEQDSQWLWARGFSSTGYQSGTLGSNVRKVEA